MLFIAQFQQRIRRSSRSLKATLRIFWIDILRWHILDVHLGIQIINYGIKQWDNNDSNLLVITMIIIPWKTSLGYLWDIPFLWNHPQLGFIICIYIYTVYEYIYMYIHNIGWCNVFNGPPFDGWLPGWCMALGLPVYLASRLRPATD